MPVFPGIWLFCSIIHSHYFTSIPGPKGGRYRERGEMHKLGGGGLPPPSWDHSLTKQEGFPPSDTCGSCRFPLLPPQERDSCTLSEDEAFPYLVCGLEQQCFFQSSLCATALNFAYLTVLSSGQWYQGGQGRSRGR